jgi:glutathione S-transferase
LAAGAALDAALHPGGYLVDGRFTVADVNTVKMFNGPVSASLDLSRHKAVEAWLLRCRERPAAQLVLDRIKAALE